MFSTIMNLSGLNKFRGAVAAGSMLVAMAGVPSSALAHHHGFHLDLVMPDAPVIVTAPAACVGDPAQVWVEATYRTVTDRQWIEPTYQSVTQRVYVPDQFGWHDAVAYDFFGHPFVRRERVLVRPGHYEDQLQQQVVCEGHWQEVQRQELIAPAHWETRVQPVYAPAVIQPAGVRLEIPLPF